MENTNVSDKIVEKIQKLLALANSSNEHEAKLAADTATRLLTKHNLSLQNVETKDRAYDSAEFTGTSSRIEPHQNPIFNLLIKFFFVQVVIGFKRSPTGAKVRTWSIFGQKHNVEIALYVYDFLDQTYRNLYAEYARKGNPTGVTARKSFYLGLTNGLKEQLSKAKTQVESETGLVVVRDPGVDQYIQSSIGKTRKCPVRSTSIDSEAFNQGTEQGRKLNIARGIGTGSAKPQVGATKLIA